MTCLGKSVRWRHRLSQSPEPKDCQVYYFQSSQSPNLFWVDFTKLDLKEGAPARTIDAYDPTLAGEVSGHFKK